MLHRPNLCRVTAEAERQRGGEPAHAETRVLAAATNRRSRRRTTAPDLPLGARIARPTPGLRRDNPSMETAAYLEGLTTRLQTARFEVVEGPAGSVAFFRHTRGKAIDIDTVVVARLTANASRDQVREASASGFGFAKALISARRQERKARLVAYVAIVSDGVDDRAHEFVAKFHPKHWMASEVPVLVDLASGKVSMLGRRPLWGAAYFSGNRDEVAAWFPAR